MRTEVMQKEEERRKYRAELKRLKSNKANAAETLLGFIDEMKEKELR